jgi:phosphoribosyl-dephospho-CoA transferase
MPADVPSRHELVWLAPGWRRALAAPLLVEGRGALEAWIAWGRPLVACRRPSTSPDAVALGLTLPPGETPRRAALLVRRSAVERVEPPLALEQVVPGAPAAWRAPLAALARAARAAGLTLRVYGSLAWQHLSGAAYVTGGSDADLLVPVRDAAELRRAVELLEPRAAGAEPRLDGELLLPGGRAVAWRELLSRPRTILVKSGAAVSLERTADLLAASGGSERDRSAT